MTRLLNADLRNVFAWSVRNNLPINTSKTKAILFKRNRRIGESLPTIIFGYDTIAYVDKISNLGVIFQNDLEWDSHVNHQSGKIYAGLRHLKTTTSFLPSSVKIKLFKTLLLPHFIYGAELLLNASARAIGRMRVALNSCVRWVFGISRYSSVTQYQPKLIGCPFSEFYKLRACLALCKIIITLKPFYLLQNLQSSRSNRARNFILPQFHTSHYGDTFFVRGIVNWNNLPTNIKEIPIFSKFRRECTAWHNRRS